MASAPFPQPSTSLMNNDGVEQIVRRERRERASQLTRCAKGALIRAAASTQPFARIAVSERRAVATRSRRKVRDDPIATAPGSDTRGAV